MLLPPSAVDAWLLKLLNWLPEQVPRSTQLRASPGRHPPATGPTWVAAQDPVVQATVASLWNGNVSATTESAANWRGTAAPPHSLDLGSRDARAQSTCNPPVGCAEHSWRMPLPDPIPSP